MIDFQAEKLTDIEFYTEGPAVGPDGNFFFTTLTGGKIMTLHPEMGTKTWAAGVCPNGQTILPNGEHWVCETTRGQIIAYHPHGRLKEIVVDGVCAGVPFTTPNDLIIDSKGNLFFTDSVRDNGKVFFIGNDDRQKLLADHIDYANGLVLNHAEDILYVAESYGNRVLALNVTDKKTERSILIDLPAHPSGDPVKNLPDGLAIDKQGRIWVAHYGMEAIQVVSPEGKLVYTIDTGLPLTSNLAFISDTPRKKTILVTGGYGEPGPGAVVKITVNFPNT